MSASLTSKPLAGLLVGALVVGVLAVSAIGVGGAWLATVVGVASVWIASGALAGAYVAGAWGLGAGALRWMDDRTSAAWLAPAVGLGLMLGLSHGLGLVGAFEWFGAGGRRAVAGVPIVLGLVLLAFDFLRRRSGESGSVHPALLAAVPGLAVLIVAAASPPGWLWASEGLGYDTRSYHAQLPAEWLEMGRLWPLEHNVYSFLPGYMEGAFYHLAAIVGTHPASGSGVGLMAFQCLSAVVLVVAVVLVGRVCWVCARGSGGNEEGITTEGQRHRGGSEGKISGEEEEGRERRPFTPALSPRTGRGREEQEPRAGAWGSDMRGSGIATAVAGLVLATPWMVVTGSLAYNEPAVLALGAGAMLAVLAGPRSHVLRWVMAAFLVGSACGAKPTALFMVGPVVGALLLAMTPMRVLLKCGLAGAVVGFVTLMPWLVRNELAAGNPVFPQLASVFGQGHWTGEQHARWASGHRFDGSVVDRVRLLLLPDPGGPHLGGTSMRGLLHPHWGVLGVACVLAGVVGPIVRRNGVVIALAVGLGLQIVAWLGLTHLQSRFLAPVVLAGGPLVAVSLGRAGSKGMWLAVALAVVQGGWGVLAYSREGRGQPGLAIGPGVGIFTGQIDPAASPHGVVNFGLPEGAGRVLLVGDGAPLYYLAVPLYTTTWDAGILVDVMEATGGDAAAQAASLKDAGVRWLLIDEHELLRLRGSGWLHPALTARAVGELVVRGRPVADWPGPGGLGRIVIDLGPL